MLSVFILGCQILPCIFPLILCVEFYRITNFFSICCCQLKCCFFRTFVITVVVIIPCSCYIKCSTWNYGNLYRVGCNIIPFCNYTDVTFFNTCNYTFIYSCNASIVALPCDFRILNILSSIPCFRFNCICIALYYSQLICRSKNQSCVRCYFYLTGSCRIKRITFDCDRSLSRRNSCKMQHSSIFRICFCCNDICIAFNHLKF